MIENQAKLKGIRKYIVETIEDAARWQHNAREWNEVAGTYLNDDEITSTMDYVVNDIMDILKEYGEYCKKNA